MSFKDKEKFRFSETFNNANGKTSGSGFIGVILGLVCASSFVGGMVGWWMGVDGYMEVFDMILRLGMTSALLLGARKITSGFGKDKS